MNEPVRTSEYISDVYYAEMVAAYTDWQTDDREITDPGLIENCTRLLLKEARLLEHDRHQEWLDLYALDCAYWVPATRPAGDPRTQVAIAFDDRRRLEDRIFRLQNDYAWSQQPASRTARLISNIAVFSTDNDDIFMVRSSFVIHEFQIGDMRVHAGWNGHRLRWRGKRWEIQVKQVNLINCDQNLRNPSITF